MHQKTAENPSGPGITPVYVFLDFDGVTHPWSQAEDFRCLPVLEAVLRDYPETRVVISSDWRTLFSLPKLVARGFKGDIYATLATRDLLEVLLKDSAHIQMMDAERTARRRREGRGHEREPTVPLYSLAHVASTLEQVQARAYGQRFEPHPAVTVRFQDAGHILGSAIVELWLADGHGGSRKLVASGDLGQPGRVILRDPTPILEADLLLIESTYGDRQHKSTGDTLEELVDVVTRTAPHGNVVIPAFAVGRTQELLYHFLQLIQQQRLPPVEIFVDSPMAVAATDITLRHFGVFDEEARQLLGSVRRLKESPHIHFISDVEDSIKLNRIKSGAVIISASGMCEAGRIKYHLRENLPRSECSVLIAGFQAAGTLGRRLVDGARLVHIFSAPVPVRARIYTVGGLSAHADQAELLHWLQGFHTPPRHTFVMHGEAEASAALARRIHEDLGWSGVTVPRAGTCVSL